MLQFLILCFIVVCVCYLSLLLPPFLFILFLPKLYSHYPPHFSISCFISPNGYISTTAYASTVEGTSQKRGRKTVRAGIQGHLLFHICCETGSPRNGYINKIINRHANLEGRISLGSLNNNYRLREEI